MKKKVLKTLAFIALALLGTLIGVMISFETTGKYLVFGSMLVISLAISAWIFYHSAKQISNT